MSLTKPTSYCLGLTGGIACGKSTVGALLHSRGLTRIDSDQVARQVVEPGTPGLNSVVEAFGNSVLRSDGRLDRGRLGQIVFEDEASRRRLEGILHPLIWESLVQEMSSAELEARETVFEIPLLFENGNQGRFSWVWVVSVTEEIQFRRLQERDGLTPDQIQARLAAQMSLEEKKRLADFVIVNDGDLRSLEKQVDEGLRGWRLRRGAT